METKQTTKKTITLVEYVVIGCILTYLYLLSIHAMRYIDFVDDQTTYCNLVITSIASIVLFFLILKLPYPISLFGFNTNRWRRYVVESIIFSILFNAFITGVKWLLIKNVPVFHHLPLICLKSGNMMNGHSKSYFGSMESMLLYFLLSIPLQTFLVQSAVQSPVLNFLRNKHRGLISIILATLWFSVMHLSLSFSFAIAMLFPGLFVSSLYYRQKSLIGVWLAHAIIGIWGINFIGVVDILHHFH